MLYKYIYYVTIIRYKIISNLTYLVGQSSQSDWEVKLGFGIIQVGLFGYYLFIKKSLA